MTDAERPRSFHDRATAAEFLRGLGRWNEARLPVGAAALALAALDRPRVDLGPYHRHLAELAREVSEAAAGIQDLDGRAAALNEIILGRHGYEGDTLTCEDLQNAKLIGVIDRRKGLPAALRAWHCPAPPVPEHSAEA